MKEGLGRKMKVYARSYQQTPHDLSIITSLIQLIKIDFIDCCKRIVSNSHTSLIDASEAVDKWLKNNNVDQESQFYKIMASTSECMENAALNRQCPDEESKIPKETIVKANEAANGYIKSFLDKVKEAKRGEIEDVVSRELGIETELIGNLSRDIEGNLLGHCNNFRAHSNQLRR